MSQQLTNTTGAISVKKTNDTGALLVGTGLAVASMILVPALAMRLGLGASLTGALRIALMRASAHAANGSRDDSGSSSVSYSCH